MYIIFRIIYFINYNNKSETYDEITKNIQILYENLTGPSASFSGMYNPSISNINISSNTPSFKLPPSSSINNYRSYFNSPTRTIDIAMRLPSGAIQTRSCTGKCINCKVGSLDSNGCYVLEAK